MLYMVSEVAHQLKGKGRQLFGAGFDASYRCVMFGFVSPEELDEVAAMVLEVTRDRCRTLSFE